MITSVSGGVSSSESSGESSSQARPTCGRNAANPLPGLSQWVAYCALHCGVCIVGGTRIAECTERALLTGSAVAFSAGAPSVVGEPSARKAATLIQKFSKVSRN